MATDRIITLMRSMKLSSTSVLLLSSAGTSPSDSRTRAACWLKSLSASTRLVLTSSSLRKSGAAK